MNTKQTTLHFPSALPANEVLLSAVKTAFPEAKVKLAYKGFTDIYQDDVHTALDITVRKIYVRSQFDEMATKNLLLAALFPSRRYTKPYSTDIETQHQAAVLFLVEHYREKAGSGRAEFGGHLRGWFGGKKQ